MNCSVTLCEDTNTWYLVLDGKFYIELLEEDYISCKEYLKEKEKHYER